ncbi:MAG: hypothetical protein UH081_07975 [Clostridia bacterium]|nr:hypothetical protein [Clostridia bacterium]
MRKLKFISVLSVILTAMICACTVSSYASEYDDTAEVRAVLRKINVITDEEYDPSSEITRVKYLEMILQAIKFDSGAYAENAKQIFFDVPAEDENAAIVNLGFDMGIITGHPDGRFCPEDSITLDEAVIMAIRAAGAGDFMNAGVGWMQSAASLDLLDKVFVEAGSAITRTHAERIVFNMLNASLVESDNGKDWYLNGESSLLELKHSLERATGIVDANSFANLYGGNKLPSGQISVNNTVYELEAEFDGLFIGENVVFYYEKDRYSGEGEKIIYICSGANEFAQADSEATERLNSSVFEYYVEDEKEEMQISSKAVTLENGIKTTMPSGGYSLPKYGKIKAIDNDNDGEADVILVTNTTIGLVNIVANEVIYFKNKPATNIKLEEYKNVVIKNKEGEVLTLESVTTGALTEICAASDKSYIEIKVLNDTASVTVKGLEERSENGYSVWYVSDNNGNALRTVRDFESICPDNELMVGGSYTVLLSSDGYIAAIVGETEMGAMKYGYVLKPFERDPVGDGNVVLRILTSEGVVAEFLTEEKLSDVSANERISNTQLLSLCADKQVIRYGLNSEGNINKIEFASSDPTTDGLKIGGTTPSSNNGLSRYYTSTSLIGGEIAVDKQTVIFMVPDAEYENDLSKYRVAGINNLVNERYYKNMIAYVYGDEVYAKAIVYNSNVTSVVRDSSRMIVSHISTVYDETDGLAKKALVGLVEGKEKTYLIEDESVLNYTPTGGSAITVDEGDIIRYETDINGKISYIKLVFDSDKKALYGTTDGNDDSVTYGSDVVHTYGTVAEKFDNYFRVIRNGQTEKSSYLYPITSATYIYEYDSTKKRDQRIRTITFAEVMALEDDSELTDKVVMITRSGTLPFMVIYK